LFGIASTVGSSRTPQVSQKSRQAVYLRAVLTRVCTNGISQIQHFTKTPLVKCVDDEELV
jgi:hypothetical protein